MDNQWIINGYGCCLVVSNPLKSIKVNWDDDVPNTWENKNVSNPPTRKIGAESTTAKGLKQRNDGFSNFLNTTLPNFPCKWAL